MSIYEAHLQRKLNQAPDLKLPEGMIDCIQVNLTVREYTELIKYLTAAYYYMETEPERAKVRILKREIQNQYNKQALPNGKPKIKGASNPA